MRTIIILFSVCLLIITSCQKNLITKTYPTGKWKIVTDSTTQGLAAANHFVIYKGTINDYVDFTSDGKVYIKEGENLTDLSYKSLSATRVIINSFASHGKDDKCEILKISDNDILITTYFLYSPGGTFGRSMHLTK